MHFGENTVFTVSAGLAGGMKHDPVIHRHGTKDPAFFNPRTGKPPIKRIFYPRSHWHRANMRTFTNQIENDPVSLAGLDVIHRQLDKFGAPKSTPKQDREHRVISPFSHHCSVSSVQ
jgi:hypothetical protein